MLTSELAAQLLLRSGFWFGMLLCSVLVLQCSATFFIRRLHRVAGRGAYLGLGLIGVPMHEAFHAIACPLFGHKIKRINWYSHDPGRAIHGSVEHYWAVTPYATIGCFFIAMAPLIGGLAFLWFLSATLLPHPEHLIPNWQSANVWEIHIFLPHWLSQWTVGVAANASAAFWPTALYLVLSLSVALFMAPSRQDLANALPGAAALTLVYFLLAWLAPTAVFHLDSFLLRWLSQLLVISVFVSVLCLSGGLVLSVISRFLAPALRLKAASVRSR